VYVKGAVEKEDPDDDTDNELEAFKRVPIDRKMMTTLPPGARMSQFKPEHPTTSYEAFQEKCLGEAVRPLAYPLNLALGTSQKFNFSSSKLDHTNYRNTLTNEREDCNRVCLNPTFAEFYLEAILVGAIPPWNGRAIPPHEWHWPGFESLDPVTDANADHSRLSNGTQTYREFWARRGVDWKDALGQLAAERDELKRLDLQFGEPATRTITEDEPDTNGGEGKPANGRGGSEIRAFDEGKVKRDGDGKFSSTGSSSDHSSSLKEKARGIAKGISKLGSKAVAAARSVADKAKNVATAIVTAGVHADDVLDTAHDWSKITNDKAMNASIAEHLGIPLNAAVQGAIVKVLAFGIVKAKHWLAKRREAKSDASATGFEVFSDKVSVEKRAKVVADILAKFLTEMGADKAQLPTPADLAKFIRKQDAAEARGGAALAC
jgi:hypothetical protein